MRDLIRLSDEELHELTTAQRLRMFVAIGISAACGIISLQGMAALFTDATVVPLPGMQHLAGQIAWAVSLVAMLIAVTYLVRGVIKRRLQWAIALSLLIHFLLCVSMTTVEFRGPRPLPVQGADSPDVSREEFSLPDYASDSVPNPDAAWLKPTDSETPEIQLDPDRPEMEIADAEKPDDSPETQPVEAQAIETLERQEKVELTKESLQQMQRQAGDASLPEQAAIDQPTVDTATAADVTLDAMAALAKQSATVPEIERSSDEIAAAEMKIEAASVLAQRTTNMATPEDVAASRAERTSANVEAIINDIEAAEMAASDVKTMALPERKFDVTRQSSAAASSASFDVPASDSSAATNQAIVQSRVPNRSQTTSNQSDVAPTDGGSVSMARSGADSPDAVLSGDANLGSVDVATTSNAAASMLKESASSKAGQRKNSALALNGGKSNDARSELSNASNGESNGAGPTGVKIARSNGFNSQPDPGDGGAAMSITPSRRPGQSAGAVGTTVAEQGFAAAGTRAETSADGLIRGPAGTSVGRRPNGLPTRSGSGEPGSLNGTGKGSSTAIGEASGTMQARSAAIDGSRATEPSARLDADAGFAKGLLPGLAMSRATASVSGLPSGASEAEQSGTLVFAGPQANMTAGGISGPRIGSLPRRSAGLPGASGPVGTALSPGSDSSQPAKVAANTGRRAAGNDRPSLASAETIAGLVKRSVPGLGSSPEARIAESLSMRTTDARREAARTLGGSEASEEAVERGLKWLAANQYPDGHWSIHDFPGEHPPDISEGSFQSNSAATGLALLAYLGAGYTHQSGNYQDVVSRGMKWLIDRQKPNGDLFADETEFVWFYSHGIAAIAICEAYGLTKDATLKDPAQKALDFIVESQHPEFGGWRYRPQFESDTSVSGWQLMALKSGEMAGLNVSKASYSQVGKWLDSVESKTSPGQFSYHPTRKASPAMTAEGLLMRQYLGTKRNDPQLIAGANFLRTRLPDFGQRDAYFWYYGTQVMFHMQGEYWEDWNSGLRDMLVNTQSKEGRVSGSWDPLKPSAEKWANGGGRHYLTCLNLLMLEVYYRHLPLYLELEK